MFIEGKEERGGREVKEAVRPPTGQTAVSGSSQKDFGSPARGRPPRGELQSVWQRQFSGCRDVTPTVLLAEPLGIPLSWPHQGLTYPEGQHTILCWPRFCRARQHSQGSAVPAPASKPSGPALLSLVTLLPLPLEASEM